MIHYEDGKDFHITFEGIHELVHRKKEAIPL
jgi:hypothetical protein